MQLNIYEAKSKLSNLLDRAIAGETVVIARAGEPLVRLVPVKSAGGKSGVIFGGALNVAITWLFVIEPLRAHLSLNVAMAVMIGLLIFLISAMDEPFRGSLRVSSDAFKEVHGKIKNDETAHGKLPPVSALPVESPSARTETTPPICRAHDRVLCPR